MEKCEKRHTKAINSKYDLQRGIKHFIWLMNHILDQIFRTVLNSSLKNLGENTNNP